MLIALELVEIYQGFVAILKKCLETSPSIVVETQ